MTMRTRQASRPPSDIMSTPLASDGGKSRARSKSVAPTISDAASDESCVDKLSSSRDKDRNIVAVKGRSSSIDASSRKGASSSLALSLPIPKAAPAPDLHLVSPVPEQEWVRIISLGDHVPVKNRAFRAVFHNAQKLTISTRNPIIAAYHSVWKNPERYVWGQGGYIMPTDSIANSGRRKRLPAWKRSEAGKKHHWPTKRAARLALLSQNGPHSRASAISKPLESQTSATPNVIPSEGREQDPATRLARLRMNFRAVFCSSEVSAGAPSLSRASSSSKLDSARSVSSSGAQSAVSYTSRHGGHKALLLNNESESDSSSDSGSDVGDQEEPRVDPTECQLQGVRMIAESLLTFTCDNPLFQQLPKGQNYEQSMGRPMHQSSTSHISARPETIQRICSVETSGRGVDLQHVRSLSESLAQSLEAIMGDSAEETKLQMMIRLPHFQILLSRDSAALIKSPEKLRALLLERQIPHSSFFGHIKDEIHSFERMKRFWGSNLFPGQEQYHRLVSERKNDEWFMRGIPELQSCIFFTGVDEVVCLVELILEEIQNWVVRRGRGAGAHFEVSSFSTSSLWLNPRIINSVVANFPFPGARLMQSKIIACGRHVHPYRYVLAAETCLLPYSQQQLAAGVEMLLSDSFSLALTFDNENSLIQALNNLKRSVCAGARKAFYDICPGFPDHIWARCPVAHHYHVNETPQPKAIQQRTRKYHAQCFAQYKAAITQSKKPSMRILRAIYDGAEDILENREDLGFALDSTDIVELQALVSNNGEWTSEDGTRRRFEVEEKQREQAEIKAKLATKNIGGRAVVLVKPCPLPYETAIEVHDILSLPPQFIDQTDQFVILASEEIPPNIPRHKVATYQWYKCCEVSRNGGDAESFLDVDFSPFFHPRGLSGGAKGSPVDAGWSRLSTYLFPMSIICNYRHKWPTKLWDDILLSLVASKKNLMFQPSHLKSVLKQSPHTNMSAIYVVSGNLHEVDAVTRNSLTELLQIEKNVGEDRLRVFIVSERYLEESHDQGQLLPPGGFTLEFDSVQGTFMPTLLALPPPTPNLSPGSVLSASHLPVETDSPSRFRGRSMPCRGTPKGSARQIKRVNRTIESASGGIRSGTPGKRRRSDSPPADENNARPLCGEDELCPLAAERLRGSGKRVKQAQSRVTSKDITELVIASSRSSPARRPERVSGAASIGDIGEEVELRPSTAAALTAVAAKLRTSLSSSCPHSPISSRVSSVATTVAATSPESERLKQGIAL